ncbi:MAG: type II toxin-antitoxin system prevent-host-death family antitoxin [Rhodopseudomonas sp.]|uniref:type II toxin-antitoxin system Phd/YefM family antitoxin n=1 Tax=Rhodopseudomonas sp. TaxID=1078 RepID=UPI00180437DE|nr:type II toxin-antitoxin system prevent-host-death family antitoxin [Rhodopseudomonas sp.]NVN87072.1 type II toxin-antitoxin system prevent-host-death family antitoxin [Rhodopseudomonas sp.]
MKQIGIFEAKAQLSSLLDEVERGGEVTITRHGKPIAKLVQATAELSPDEIAKRKHAIRNLRALARKLKIPATQDEIKAWINEGRR